MHGVASITNTRETLPIKVVDCCEVVVASIFTSIAVLGLDFKPALTRADAAALPLKQLPMVMLSLFSCRSLQQSLLFRQPGRVYGILTLQYPRPTRGTLEAVCLRP